MEELLNIIFAEHNHSPEDLVHHGIDRQILSMKKLGAISGYSRIRQIVFKGGIFPMDELTKNELEIIGGGMVWFALLLAGFTSLTVIGGGLYLGFLGSKMYY